MSRYFGCRWLTWVGVLVAFSVASVVVSIVTGARSEEVQASLEKDDPGRLEQLLAEIRSRNMGTKTDLRVAISAWKELEAECLELLYEYKSREDKGKIYAAIAYIYSERGYRPLAGDITQQALKAIEYCEKAIEYPLAVLDAGRLHIYWADALQIANRASAEDEFAAARREIAVVCLTGLKLVLANQTTTKVQPLPVVNLFCYSGSKDDPAYQELLKTHEAEVAARKRALLQDGLIRYRDVMTQKIVSLYSREPYATDELKRLTGEILKSEEVTREIFDKVEEKRHEEGRP